MSNKSAAQGREDRARSTNDPDSVSDSVLLEDALLDAVDAHEAGLLAAPFGVDELTLKRARRRALRADIRRLLASGWPDHSDGRDA